VVGAEFALGIDEDEENTDIFDEASDGGSGVDEVDNKKRDKNNGPDNEPATVEEFENF